MMLGTRTTGAGAPIRGFEHTAGRDPTLPSQLLRCMTVDRATMNRVFRGGRSSDRARCPGSLPVMLATEAPMLPEGTVSVSMGPLPRGDVLSEFTDLFRDAIHRKDPEVMAESALWFYSNLRNFDPAVLGGLVPAGGDARNNGSACRGSLMLMGGPPQLRGRQIDGTLEVLGPGDDAYEFLLQAWMLFMGRDNGSGCRLERACLFRIE